MIAALMTGVLLVMTVMACISDFRSLRIPNAYSIIVAAAYAIAYLTGHDSFGPDDKLSAHLLSLVMIFVVTYIFFVMGFMGGGDSKFGSALALWIGLKGFWFYVFWMALAGGFITALSLFIRNSKPFANPPAGSCIAQLQEGRNAVPYGIAISFGAWVALAQTGFLSHQLDEVIKIIH